MPENNLDVCPVGASLYFLPVETRVPLKFGRETLTSVTVARAIRVRRCTLSAFAEVRTRADSHIRSAASAGPHGLARESVSRRLLRFSRPAIARPAL